MSYTLNPWDLESGQCVELTMMTSGARLNPPVLGWVPSGVKTVRFLGAESSRHTYFKFEDCLTGEILSIPDYEMGKFNLLEPEMCQKCKRPLIKSSYCGDRKKIADLFHQIESGKKFPVVHEASPV